MILAMKKPQVEPGAFSYISALLLFPGIESINIMEKILKTGIKKGLPAFYIIGAEGGVEPPRAFAHMTLNHARLPIPPLQRNKYIIKHN